MNSGQPVVHSTLDTENQNFCINRWLLYCAILWSINSLCFTTFSLFYMSSQHTQRRISVRINDSQHTQSRISVRINDSIPKPTTKTHSGFIVMKQKNELSWHKKYYQTCHVSLAHFCKGHCLMHFLFFLKVQQYQIPYRSGCMYIHVHH